MHLIQPEPADVQLWLWYDYGSAMRCCVPHREPEMYVRKNSRYREDGNSECIILRDDIYDKAALEPNDIDIRPPVYFIRTCIACILRYGMGGTYIHICLDN